MKLSNKPCRIIGVRVGEVTANLLSPTASTLSAKFVLLGPDGQNNGSFTKEASWGEKTVEAFKNFIDMMEADVLMTLFDDQAESEATDQPSGLSFPPVPTLGGRKRDIAP